MLFLKTLRCKNGELEYQVKMEDTNYDAKIFGRRTRVKVNKVMMQYLKALQKTLDFRKIPVVTISSDCTVLQRARH